MKLGLALPHAGRQVGTRLELVRHAERLGYDSVWSAELYGSDAFTPLAFLAGQTERIKLCTGLVQTSARTPAACAMAAATLDQLAGGGRVILGVGVSGPQIVEGWYGQPWHSPIGVLRSYVTVLRGLLNREPSAFDEAPYALPYRGSDGIGQGRPLKLLLHPPAKIPIYIGCGGPASTALTAEIADGWLPLGLTPDNWSQYEPHLATGAGRSGRAMTDLAIHGSVTVEVTNDVAGALDRRKGAVAFRVGGYGSATHNFHRDAMVRRGYGDAAEHIASLFASDRREEAAAAVPDAYIDDTGLFGDVARIRERFDRYLAKPYSGLTVHTDNIETLELMAELAGLSPVADDPAISDPGTSDPAIDNGPGS